MTDEVKFPQPYPELGSFPESGDRAPGPDDRIVRPSAQRMPYDTKGKFIGEPRFPTIPFVPDDIEFFMKRRIWVRKVKTDAWTTQQNRAVILSWLSSYMNARSWASTWNLVERNTMDRSQTIFAKYPRLIITITSKVGIQYEVGLIMKGLDIDDPDQLQAKLEQGGSVIDNLYARR